MRINRAFKACGPFQPVLLILLLGLAVLSLSRLGLVVWQFKRVTAATDLTTIFLQGVRADLIMLGLLLVPLMLVMPLFANRIGWPLWRRLSMVWGVFAVALLVFMETSTPTFIMQYDLRPNRLFVEYLEYPGRCFPPCGKDSACRFCWEQSLRFWRHGASPAFSGLLWQMITVPDGHCGRCSSYG